MIAKLRGRIDAIGEDNVIIDVQGVGYLVFASSRTLAALPAAGESVSLFIETHVREDHIHLYGFIEVIEQAWFKALCGVQGVGTRVAFAILSALSAHEIAQAISFQDKTILVRAPHVGPKLAQRILMELKDKAVGIGAAGEFSHSRDTATAPAAGSAAQDAVSALINLGYRPQDADRAVAQAARDARDAGADATVEALIPAALKVLA